MIGMKMSSDVAYKLSQSWDRRYTSLRRVRAEDMEKKMKSPHKAAEDEADLFPLGTFPTASHLQTY